MGETTGISWTDHTFNPWIGCTKVSEGCAHCYAEAQNKRYGWVENGWGVNGHRRRTSTANWKKPIEWSKKAMAEGKTRRVFCASLADVFDQQAPAGALKDLWKLIYDTGEYGGLEWLILTKRPQNIEFMAPTSWAVNPPDYVRIGVTVENERNTGRIFDLNAYWHGKNFVSYEPAIGPVTLPMRVDWVICGGESGAGCRPFDLQWARDMRDQCRASNTPFFMKQLGGHPDKRHDPEQWPVDLRIQEFPGI